MHHIRLTLDETTFQHIRKDAEIRDLTITEWVTQAFSTFLHHSEPIKKEIYLKDGEPESCRLFPLRVEYLHSTIDPAMEPDITRLLRENKELREEIDRLAATGKSRPGYISWEEADLIRLNGEIEKGSIQLDTMEMEYERFRIDYERLSSEGADRDTLSHMQENLERLSYEIQGFRKELDLLMKKRDQLRNMIEKKSG
jgi:hypothetical protein